MPRLSVNYRVKEKERERDEKKQLNIPIMPPNALPSILTLTSLLLLAKEGSTYVPAAVVLLQLVSLAGMVLSSPP